MTPIQKAVLKENPHFTEFHEIVSWYIKKGNEKTETISEKTGISIRTVTDLRSKNAGNTKHDLNLLVALAIGLKMTPEHAMQMINLNGHYLRDNKPIERYYKYLLSVSFFYCVAACNDFLIANGFEPLTDNNNINCM